jgi:hypothetical protein
MPDIKTIDFVLAYYLGCIHRLTMVGVINNRLILYKR